MVMLWCHRSSTDTVADSAFSAGSVSGNQLAQCLEGWCWWGQEWALRLSLWRPPPCLASLWSLAGLLPAPRPVFPPPSQLPVIHLWSPTTCWALFLATEDVRQSPRIQGAYIPRSRQWLVSVPPSFLVTPTWLQPARAHWGLSFLREGVCRSL